MPGMVWLSISGLISISSVVTPSLSISNTVALYNTKMVKAIGYSLRRWEGEEASTYDGRIEIDNNKIDNKIRLQSLRQKNYLFEGSDESVTQLTFLYTILGTARAHGLNEHRYLTWLLQKITTHEIYEEALSWLPHEWDDDLRKLY